MKIPYFTGAPPPGHGLAALERELLVLLGGGDGAARAAEYGAGQTAPPGGDFGGGPGARELLNELRREADASGGAPAAVPDGGEPVGRIGRAVRGALTRLRGYFGAEAAFGTEVRGSGDGAAGGDIGGAGVLPGAGTEAGEDSGGDHAGIYARGARLPASLGTDMQAVSDYFQRASRRYDGGYKKY